MSAGMSTAEVEAPSPGGAPTDGLTWHLVRTRKGRPARFRGESIVRLTSEPRDPGTESHELELFVTETEAFVVVVNQIAPDGTQTTLSMFQALTADKIRQHVAGIDPLAHLPVPAAILEGKTMAEILEAHRWLAQRIETIRADLRALCERALGSGSAELPPTSAATMVAQSGA